MSKSGEWGTSGLSMLFKEISFLLLCGLYCLLVTFFFLPKNISWREDARRAAWFINLLTPHFKTEQPDSKTKALGEYFTQKQVTWSPHALHLQIMRRNACAQLVNGVINALFWALLGQGQGAEGSWEDFAEHQIIFTKKPWHHQLLRLSNFNLFFSLKVFLLWILKSTLKS